MSNWIGIRRLQILTRTRYVHVHYVSIDMVSKYLQFTHFINLESDTQLPLSLLLSANNRIWTLSFQWMSVFLNIVDQWPRLENSMCIQKSFAWQGRQCLSKGSSCLPCLVVSTQLKNISRLGWSSSDVNYFLKRSPSEHIDYPSKTMFLQVASHRSLGWHSQG